MKTPGQLLAELLQSSESSKESKRKELEETSKRALESCAPPGTVISFSIVGFTDTAE